MPAVSGPSHDDAVTTGGGLVTSSTRAFLFADLRGYTTFAEERGAAAAADLLERYRALVREAVERFSGAEIRTEGDSFYVVFGSVSQAVSCGLAIVRSAATASEERPDAPIRVGVGIHAGETVEADGGFVGTPVNVAARLCALAGPGEVLVSDTVRVLTQAVTPVTFEPRGRRQVKGVSEPIAVFSVATVEEGADAWQAGLRSRRARQARRRRLGFAAITVVGIGLGVAAAAFALRPPPSLPAGPWVIGVDLPLTGPVGEDYGVAIADSVKLAVEEANAAGDLGVELRVDVRDHGSADEQVDFEAAVANTAALVADPRVVALVGPANSFIAVEQVPISNAAGLLHCSPSVTDPGLTKPRDGALDLRSAAPERINFIRTAPADDIQGKAAASFLLNDLGVRHALVIEDTETEGAMPASRVTDAFEKLGGSITGRSLNPGAAPATVLEPLASAGDGPTAVFYAGFDTDRALELRAAMADAGHGDLPFVAWDWIGYEAEMISVLGQVADGTYVTHAAFAPPRSAFVDRYRAAYGREPGEYDAAAYACVEVVLAALRDVTTAGPSADALREALRASAVDLDHRYETVLGTIGFDANGDSLQQFAQILRAEPGSDTRQPEWVIESAQDYGPAQ
jgi:ABC-type branched-subunit amino acid transport system substrate-binding protein